MIYEYAIDPESSSELLWQALTQFGIHRGRILCECPSSFRKKLKKAIYEAAGDDHIERDRLVAEFEKMLDEGWVVRRGNSAYDHTQETWLCRILPEHRRQPFRGLICDGPKEIECVLNKYDLRDANGFWFVDQTPLVKRTANEIAAAFAPLGRISTDLLIIDPYFGEKPHAFESIPAIVAASVCDQSPLERVEIHTVHGEFKKDGKRLSEFERSIKHAMGTAFRSQLPRGLQLRVCIWETLHDRDAFHDRYVLTNLGGVGITLGLDVGGERQADFENHMNTMFLLSPPTYRRRKDQFDTESVEFKRRASAGYSEYRLKNEFTLKTE